MKFVSLERKEGKSSFQRLLKYGCGPNFTLNRRQSFNSMIKEQGTTFWFRFWLSFCTQPETPFLVLLDKYPEQFSYTYTLLHEGFIEGSSEKIIDFCWDILFAPVLVKAKPLTPVSKRKSFVFYMDQLQNEIYDAVALSFTVALCETFHSWLIAPPVDSSHCRYWVLPEKYLDSSFLPGALEYYLATFWKKKLFQLLGMSSCQLPWLSQLLVDLNSKKQIVRDVTRDKEIESYIKKIRLFVEQRKEQIAHVDEIEKDNNSV